MLETETIPLQERKFAVQGIFKKKTPKEFDRSVEKIVLKNYLKFGVAKVDPGEWAKMIQIKPILSTQPQNYAKATKKYDTTYMQFE